MTFPELLIPVFYLIIAGGYVTVIALCGLAVAGLIWMPVGIFVAVRVARKSSKNVRKYATFGAVYSIFFFIPWLFAMKWMSGNPPTDNSIRLGYIFLYIIWAFLPAFGFLLMEILVHDLVHEWFLGMASFLGILLASTSVFVLRRTKNKQGGWRVNGDPPLAYLLPMAGLYANLLAFLASLLLSIPVSQE